MTTITMDFLVFRVSIRVVSSPSRCDRHAESRGALKLMILVELGANRHEPWLLAPYDADRLHSVSDRIYHVGI